ncbi:MAG: hypothetical protein QM831_39170 [Kofleriaceae bacterium]
MKLTAGQKQARASARKVARAIAAGKPPDLEAAIVAAVDGAGPIKDWVVKQSVSDDVLDTVFAIYARAAAARAENLASYTDLFTHLAHPALRERLLAEIATAPKGAVAFLVRALDELTPGKAKAATDRVFERLADAPHDVRNFVLEHGSPAQKQAYWDAFDRDLENDPYVYLVQELGKKFFDRYAKYFDAKRTTKYDQQRRDAIASDLTDCSAKGFDKRWIDISIDYELRDLIARGGEHLGEEFPAVPADRIYALLERTLAAEPDRDVSYLSSFVAHVGGERGVRVLVEHLDKVKRPYELIQTLRDCVDQEVVAKAFADRLARGRIVLKDKSETESLEELIESLDIHVRKTPATDRGVWTMVEKLDAKGLQKAFAAGADPDLPGAQLPSPLFGAIEAVYRGEQRALEVARVIVEAGANRDKKLGMIWQCRDQRFQKSETPVSIVKKLRARLEDGDETNTHVVRYEGYAFDWVSPDDRLQIAPLVATLAEFVQPMR